MIAEPAAVIPETKVKRPFAVVFFCFRPVLPEAGYLHETVLFTDRQCLCLPVKEEDIVREDQIRGFLLILFVHVLCHPEHLLHP